jgi:hypothetical protein
MPKITWKSLFETSIYRQKFILLISLTVLLLSIMPFGFAFIQNRDGDIWNDPILELLPAFDLSWPIFILMYSLGILLIYRVVFDPNLVFKFLSSYLIITFLRFLFIFFVPLNPPADMVSLVDPITKIFYGGVEITKDLFFSGHTSTMFLIYLISENRADKYYALFVTICIAISLLFQHIHYTADVIAAFPITWLVFRFTKI